MDDAPHPQAAPTASAAPQVVPVPRGWDAPKEWILNPTPGVRPRPSFDNPN